GFDQRKNDQKEFNVNQLLKYACSTLVCIGLSNADFIGVNTIQNTRASNPCLLKAEHNVKKM
ncbi:MAG: hypothetical protein ACXWPX_10810, partial [Pseudobdellovibrio sp.]